MELEDCSDQLGLKIKIFTVWLITLVELGSGPACLFDDEILSKSKQTSFGSSQNSFCFCYRRLLTAIVEASSITQRSINSSTNWLEKNCAVRSPTTYITTCMTARPSLAYAEPRSAARFRCVTDRQHKASVLHDVRNRDMRKLIASQRLIILLTPWWVPSSMAPLLNTKHLSLSYRFKLLTL